MDDKLEAKFDELAKSVGAGIPRRTVFKRIAGGALAGLFALRGGQSLAAPRCRKAGHPCEGNQKCCPGLKCVKGAGPGNAARCVKPPKKTPPPPPKKTPPPPPKKTPPPPPKKTPPPPPKH